MKNLSELVTKEIIREALMKAVEDVGIDVAMKALCNPSLTESERIRIDKEF